MKAITAKEIAPALGPYSHAVADNHLIFCSGQLPIDRDGRLIDGDFEAQMRCIFDNISKVLSAGGGNLNTVLKATVFMTDLGRFAEMNRIYAEYFSNHHPARTTVEVAKLPMGAAVEVEVIARIFHAVL